MKTHSLKTAWGRMAYTEAGTGEPVTIFLHGSGCDNEDWREVFGFLPPAFHRIAMEFRGHGASDSPASPFSLSDLTDDVILLMDTLKRRGVILAGHSLGGMVAMDVARRDPRVHGLVLLEGWTSGNLQAPFAGDREYGNLTGAAIDAVKAKFERVLQRVTQERWNYLSKSGTKFDAYPFLETARIPVAEVYGSAGRRPDSEQRLRLPSNPNIRTIWIPGCGHYLPLENPKEVARICAEWAEAGWTLPG